MKILSVKFLNLNSLKGEHEIRFDRQPFSESGLFAITGPTGSGKTTILDAITVALYGQVHRHDKDVEEIMSRHTAECYSEVEFEVKGKSYRAKWSLRRSRGKVDGAIQAEKMELASLESGEFLGGHTTTSVKQAIKELCGLDYNQFLRSVILCQGDFTRFLKANDNERSELLEKITDTGIYSEISRFIFEKQKREKEKLDILGTQLGGVDVLPAEERETFEVQLAGVKQQEELLKKEQDDLNHKLKWLQNLKELRNKNETVTSDLQQQQQQLEENAAQFELLKRHKGALQFRPALAEIKTYEEQAANARNAAAQLKKEIPAIEQTVASAAAESSRSEELLKEAEAELIAAEPIIDKVLQVDADLHSRMDLLQKYEIDYKKIRDNYLNIQSNSELKEKQIADLEKQIGELQTWLVENEQDKELDKQLLVFNQLSKGLEELNINLNKLLIEQQDNAGQLEASRRDIAANEQAILLQQKDLEDKSKVLDEQSQLISSLLAGKSLEELEAEADGLPSLISLCEQQYRLAERYRQNEESERQTAALIRKLEGEVHSFSLSVEDLSQKKEVAEQVLLDLRQLVEIEQRILKYEDARSELKENEACPLCGSTHHPYVAEYKSNLSEQQLRRDRQEKLLKSITEELNSVNVELNTRRINLNLKREEEEKIKREIAEALNEFERNNASLPKALEIRKTEIIIAVIRNKKQQLHSLQGLITQVRTTAQKVKTQENEISKVRESLSVFNGKSKALEEKVKALVEIERRLGTSIAELDEQREKSSAALRELLQPYGISFSIESADASNKQLRRRFEAFDEASKKLAPLQLQLAEQRNDLLNMRQSLQERATETKQRAEELRIFKEELQRLKSQRMELFGDKDPVKERERLTAVLNQARMEQQARHDSLREQQEKYMLTVSRSAQLDADVLGFEQTYQQLKLALLDKLKIVQIASLEDLYACFLPDEEAEKVETTQKKIESNIAVHQRLKQELEQQIEAEVALRLCEEPEPELQSKLAQVQEAVSGLNQEIGRIKEIILKDDQLKTKFAEIAAQIELQKAEYQRWQKLNELVGSADGKKFRRFAQGLTLARLTDLANRHLLKLSDRYRILKSKENDLELLIVDTYQADAVRPMATLSGGESFLVSLALALGLSDLASRKVQINSLFIDEGFGTLDPDTLDTAISALENLHAKGKTIGIISHVEALKERIGVQIQLTRQNAGHSRIRLRSYNEMVEI